MYATKHIDWLSITFDKLEDARAVIPSADWHFVGSGHHGYRSAFEDSISRARIETDSADSSMGSHLTLSGITLHSVRSSYTNQDDGLVAECQKHGSRTSRIDLACNIHEGKLTVRDFYNAYKKGTLETKFRRVYYVEGLGSEQAGDTLYLGSPQSDRQLRIYNKAAEQGIVDGETWIRLELVLRDLRAKAAMASCVDNSTAATVSAHLADCVGFDHAEYNACLGNGNHALKEIPRRETSTQRWLRDQCAPALAKVVAVEPDFMVQFMASFQAQLDKLKSVE